jgi:hypothetical protein
LWGIAATTKQSESNVNRIHSPHQNGSFFPQQTHNIHRGLQAE